LPPRAHHAPDRTGCPVARQGRQRPPLRTPLDRHHRRQPGPQGGKHGWDDEKNGDEHTTAFDAVADLGSLQNTAKMIGADDLWTAGITGRGVDVALVDTGVAPVQDLAGPGKVVNGPDLSFESQSPDLRYLDTNGHGTHMGGVIAGQDDGEFTGIAPDARLVSVKVGAASGATDISQVIAAIDWVVQHRNDDGLNIRVLNLSFGTDGAQDYLLDPLTYAVDVAWRKGIVVVVGAGNRGPGATRRPPPAPRTTWWPASPAAAAPSAGPTWSPPAARSSACATPGPTSAWSTP